VSFSRFIRSSCVQIPNKGNIYSVNEGNAQNWDGPTTKYVEKVIKSDSSLACLIYSWFSFSVSVSV
jgi:fructose-1,6-bisphosphatase